jgi:hypothetical protein
MLNGFRFSGTGSHRASTGLFLLAISSPPDLMISVDDVEKLYVLTVKRLAFLRFHAQGFPQLDVFLPQAAEYLRHSAKLGNFIRHHLDFSL